MTPDMIEQIGKHIINYFLSENPVSEQNKSKLIEAIKNAPSDCFTVKDGPLEETALMLAIKNEDPEIIHLILGKGTAQLGVRNGNNISVLCYAAKRGYLDLVKYFLEHGDINYYSKDNENNKFFGGFLLPLVAMSGNYELYKFLVEKENFYNITPPESDSAKDRDRLNFSLSRILEYAIINNNSDFALKLIDDLRKNGKLKSLLTDLGFFYRMIERLIKHEDISDEVFDKILNATYQELNLKPINAYSLLLAAQKHGHSATSLRLINLGAFDYEKIRFHDKEDNPFIFAVKNSQYDILESLLARFRDFDFENKYEKAQTAVYELLTNALLIAFKNNDRKAINLISPHIPNACRSKILVDLKTKVDDIREGDDSQKNIKNFINGYLYYYHLNLKEELSPLKKRAKTKQELIETAFKMVNNFHDAAQDILISSKVLKNREVDQDDPLVSLMKTFHGTIVTLNLDPVAKFELLTALERRSADLFKDYSKDPSSQAVIQIYSDIATTKASLLLDHFEKLDGTINKDPKHAALVSKQLKNINSQLSIQFHRAISNSLISEAPEAPETPEESDLLLDDLSLSFSMSKRLIALLTNKPEVRDYDSESLKLYINKLGPEDKKIVDQHREAIIKLCLANDIIPAAKFKSMRLFGEQLDTSQVEATKKKDILTLFSAVPKAKTKGIRHAQLEILNSFDDHLKGNPHDPKCYIAYLQFLNFLAYQLSNETRKFWTRDHSRLEKVILLKRNEVITYLYDSGFDVNLPETMKLGEGVSSTLLSSLTQASKRDPENHPGVIRMVDQFYDWRSKVERKKIKNAEKSWKTLETRAKKAKEIIPTLEEIKPSRLKK